MIPGVEISLEYPKKLMNCLKTDQDRTKVYRSLLEFLIVKNGKIAMVETSILIIEKYLIENIN